MGTVFRKLDTPSSSVSSGFIGVGQAQPGAHRLQGNGALEESFCFFQAAVGFHPKSVAKIAHVMVGIEFQCTFKGNTHVLRVIRHNQEVEWPDQPRGETMIRYHFFTASKA